MINKSNIAKQIAEHPFEQDWETLAALCGTDTKGLIMDVIPQGEQFPSEELIKDLLDEIPQRALEMAFVAQN